MPFAQRIPVIVLLMLAILPGCREDRRQPEGSPVVQPGSASTPHEEQATHDGDCDELPKEPRLRELLQQVPGDAEAGGLFSGRKEWAAVVDRSGHLCAVAAATEDPAELWPGSQAIAKAKAYTANAFSTDVLPLSTARLYTLSQPGHSLWGAGAANPFNAKCLATPGDHGNLSERMCGGTIVFGGGVPLYRDKTRIGGLGVSGDTACADHEIAKRIRDKAGLNPPGGAFQDDITYSAADGPGIYTHPLCANTWRNGQKIGDEPAAVGY